jgi:outer membrane protein assembly factor BamB
MNTLRFVHRAMAFLLLTGALLLGASEPAAGQLAQTPWPMFQHDVRHTGRSALLGPLFLSGAPAPAGVSVWQSFGMIASSPTIASDGTIYVGVDVPRPPTSAQGYLCAIKPAMALKWGDNCVQTRASASRSAAAISIDGTIYLGDRDNTLTAFDPSNGAKKCLYNHGFEGDIHTSPTIGLDGTVYFAFSQNLYGNGVVTALNPDCSPKWWYAIGSFIDASSPAIDQKGFLYLGDVTGMLHKLQENKNVQNNTFFATRIWKVPVGTKITASPVIGSDGTVYVGSTNGLSAVQTTADGLAAKILWNFPAGIVDQTPALGSDGTIYFGVKSGLSRAIYAVAPDGTLRWQYGPVPSASPYGGFPTVGADGIVYVGFGTSVYAFSPDGVLLWSYDTGSVVSSFPVIAGTASTQTGGNAVLYVASSDWRLHAISSLRQHGSVANNPPRATAGPAQTAFVGQVVQFNGSATDQDSDVLSFAWDFGDGKSAFGPTPHHAYVADGTYTVTLTVSDGLSAASDALTVTVLASTGGALPFSDTFTREDGPAPGNGWQEAQGDLVIKGNELRNAPLKDTHIAIQPALSGLSHTAAASFASVDNNTAPRLGVVLRFQDPKNYYLLYRQMGGSSQLRISRIMNGFETILASAGTPQATVNTFFRITADATGKNLTLKLCSATDTSTGTACNTVAQKLTATDSMLAGGSVGVLIGTGTGSTQQYRVDKFAAQVQ